ncbi:MAG: hypothetical protein HQL29_02835 [Candidatus Omnitrophica bacterium]|nr:hypothetical protein [Candidatus Omnitrophota bacterium]
MEIITIATIGIIAGAGAVIAKARNKSKQLEKTNDFIDAKIPTDLNKESEIDKIISGIDLEDDTIPNEEKY